MKAKRLTEIAEELHNMTEELINETRTGMKNYAYKRTLRGKEHYYLRGRNAGRKEVTVTEDEYRDAQGKRALNHMLRSELKIISEVCALLDKKEPAITEILSKELAIAKETAPKVHKPKDDMFYEKNKTFKTLAGETVRSKSEMIIADTLYKHGLDYEYEPYFKDIRPDFIIRNSIRGEDIIWEHFGRMNDPKYVSEAVAKLQYYKNCGYEINRNLIVTFEFYGEDVFQSTYLSSSEIDLIVKNWFEM